MPAAGFREELGYARYGGQRMELLIVDCAYIEAVSAELRADLLETAAFGSDDVWEADPPEGWTSPDAENGPWYARYEFRNTSPRTSRTSGPVNAGTRCEDSSAPDSARHSTSSVLPCSGANTTGRPRTLHSPFEQHVAEPTGRSTASRLLPPSSPNGAR